MKKISFGEGDFAWGGRLCLQSPAVCVQQQQQPPASARLQRCFLVLAAMLSGAEINDFAGVVPTEQQYTGR